MFELYHNFIDYMYLRKQVIETEEKLHIATWALKDKEQELEYLVQKKKFEIAELNQKQIIDYKTENDALKQHLQMKDEIIATLMKAIKS